MKLNENFYSRRTDKVARDLLGCVLVHEKDGKIISGKIVETEAYFGEKDPGSHASRGRTPRNSIMFDTTGCVYVYLIYGMYHCLNFTTEDRGKAGAVLIRALEPMEGIDIMKLNRGSEELTNGPGRLTQALGINREHNGEKLTGNKIYVLDNYLPSEIVRTTRIGLSKGEKLRLRFYIKGNKFVSVV